MEQQVYNEDSIEYLTDIDHIRTRPGMYIGELSDPRHLLVEAIDNSVDEVLSGYCNKITVKVTQVNNKYVYSVEDTGRGIPIGLKPSPSNPDKLVSTLEIVTRYARSGGKFDNKSYKVRGGLHGVGTCVISSLSTYAKFETTRDKRKNQIIYIQKSLSDNNEVKDYNYEEVGSTTYMAFEEDNALDHVGTRVTFVPDDTKFNSCKIPLDFIVNKCKICNAQYNNVVSLYYLDEEIDVNTTFKDLIIRPEDTESIYCEKLFEVGVLGNSAKIWLEYNSSTKYSMRSFCNLIETYDGGTHYKDLIKSIENVWSEFLEKESEIKFHKDDCRVGLYGVLSISIGDPQFSSQTKEKLTVSSESLSYIFSEFEKSLREWLVANEDIRKALIRRFEIYRQEKDRMSVTKDIMKLIKINNTSSDGHIKRKSVVPKLVECSQTKVDNTEVYFVEGNSAGGTAARARNSRLQAVLPLRGKIKNITNVSIKTALQSEEVRWIVNTAGCGVGDSCDVSKSRYSKYIINSDSDVDGLHIVVLVLSVFINIMPELVKQGYVYVALPPLYGYQIKGKYYYANDMKDIPENLRATKSFTRFKGLGEMNDDQYEETCMNPETRHIMKVEYPDDIERFNRIVGSSIGKRELLSELGLLVNITDRQDKD